MAAPQVNAPEKMKKVIITQSNYIPWKGYFDGLHTADTFVVYDDMQYTKRDWRNHNQIKTPQGLQWLTIPVEVKGKYFQKINETTVSDKSWGIKHWKTIQANYAKAPFFKEYKDYFEPLYRDETTTLLTDINLSFIKAINQILGVNVEIVDSRNFELAEDKTQRLVDICKALHATDYYSGPAAQNYMDEGAFERENIKVHYFDYGGYAEYPQLFGEFAHNVSILDLIFNTGSGATNYMKSFAA